MYSIFSLILFSFLTIFPISFTSATPSPTKPAPSSPTSTPNNNPRLLDQIVAIVNGEFITESDLREYQKVGPERQFFTITSLENFPKTRETLIPFLINEKIVEQFIKENQLHIDDEQLESQVKQVEKKNNLTRAQLLKALEKEGVSFEEYASNLRKQLEKRNFIEREIRSRINITEQDVKNYYLQKYDSQKTTEAEYHLNWLQYHSDNHEKVIATLSEAEKATSGAKGSAIQDWIRIKNDDQLEYGELGKFTLEELEASLRETVPKLKIGQVSKPIKLGTQWVVVHLVNSVFKENREYDAKKQELLFELQNTEIAKIVSSWVNDKKENSYIRFFE